MTADLELRRSSLAHLGESEDGHAAVRLREIPFLTQLDLRVPPGSPAAARIGAALGIPLPTAPNTTASADPTTVLWLSPDEWLIVGPDGATPGLTTLVQQALNGDHGSVVDVSANRTVLELSGARARDVLAGGCSLDLHPRSFGPGTCAQTLLTSVAVILHRADPGDDADPVFRLLVRPSFAHYIMEWLLDAMRRRP